MHITSHIRVTGSTGYRAQLVGGTAYTGQGTYWVQGMLGTLGLDHSECVVPGHGRLRGRPGQGSTDGSIALTATGWGASRLSFNIQPDTTGMVSL